VARFLWDVQLPGEDLPQRLTTDYLLSEGEQISVQGRGWIVERVEIDETIQPATGIVWVEQPHEPADAPDAAP
jgi:hypothetical protein